MRHILAASLTLLVTYSALGARNFAGLDSLLLSYCEAISLSSDEEKFRECDYMVSSCNDSLVRQHIVTELFNHYKESRIMGEEAVAVHIWDRWISDGTVKLKGEFETMEAKMFVDFNRQSLVGADAPVLAMKDPRGKEFVFPQKGRCSILFFYDPECAKCKLTAGLLPSVLDSVGVRMDLVAVFYGDNAKAWRKWRKEFRLRNKNVRLLHLWDPGFDSGYQIAYGVSSTPKLFVIEPQGSVLGRRLEIESLSQLLPLAEKIQEKYVQCGMDSFE